MTAQPITAEPTEQTQIDTESYTIRVSDHDAVVSILSKIFDHQRSHPDVYYYTRSRSYFRPDPDNSDHELWMLVTEYDNREAYRKSLTDSLSGQHTTTEIAALQELSVPATTAESAVWTEFPELRVQFAFREPLWPGCHNGATTPADAITGAPSEQTQFDQGTFVINATDREVFAGKLKTALQHQNAHPEVFYYTRSRSFHRPHPQDPTKELVSFFDEYDDRETYLKALMNVATSQEPAAARVRELAGEFAKHVVFDDPLSSLEHKTWTELKELRVQFPTREPLWPCCTDS